jgi:hypothetical protein
VGDVPDVEQVVRDAAALLERELRGADVHAAVELHRVGVDHLPADLARQCDGEVALARGGGADDGEHGRGHAP